MFWMRMWCVFNDSLLITWISSDDCRGDNIDCLLISVWLMKIRIFTSILLNLSMSTTLLANSRKESSIEMYWKKTIFCLFHWKLLIAISGSYQRNYHVKDIHIENDSEFQRIREKSISTYIEQRNQYNLWYNWKKSIYA